MIRLYSRTTLMGLYGLDSKNQYLLHVNIRERWILHPLLPVPCLKSQSMRYGEAWSHQSTEHLWRIYASTILASSIVFPIQLRLSMIDLHTGLRNWKSRILIFVQIWRKKYMGWKTLSPSAWRRNPRDAANMLPALYVRTNPASASILEVEYLLSYWKDRFILTTIADSI